MKQEDLVIAWRATEGWWRKSGECRPWAPRQLVVLVTTLFGTSEQLVFAVEEFYKYADSAVGAQSDLWQKFQLFQLLGVI